LSRYKPICANKRAAQGTDSASSLDYIVVTAVKYGFDPATGMVSAISGAIPGTGGLAKLAALNPR
jgi:hypothetical protein